MGSPEFSNNIYLNYDNKNDVWTDLDQIVHVLDVITPKREYILNNLINTKKNGYEINSTYLAELTNVKQGEFTSIDGIINYINDVNSFDIHDFYVKLLVTINSGYNLIKIN